MGAEFGYSRAIGQIPYPRVMAGMLGVTFRHGPFSKLSTLPRGQVTNRGAHIEMVFP